MASRSSLTSRPSSSPYPSGGAGGKLRSSRRSSSRSSTPYDRPPSLLHPPPPPPSDFLPLPSSSSPSIKSRFVHSASRFLSSSASFFFSSLLGRKPLRISGEGANNEPSAVAEDGDEGVATVETSTEEQHSVQDSDEETACSLENTEPPTPQLRNDSFVFGVGAGTLVEEVRGQSSGGQEKELDLVQVEGMLKTKTLSREQVDRLTGILQTQVVESDITRPHSAGKPVNSLKKDAFVRPDEENDDEEEEEEGAALAPITEAQRWREELRRARTDLTPVELARAYMGEKTAMPARWRSLSLRSVDRQISKVPEVQPYRGLLGDNSWASPIPRSSVQTVIRSAKPAPVVDEGWMSVGPMRRARQRVFRTISHSPYARGLVSKENTMARANVSTPMQSSHTARKILDTLEKLSPSPKGRLLDGDIHLAGERTPIGHNTDRYNSGRYAQQEFSRFSNTRAAPSNGRLDFESMVQTPTRLLPQEFDATKQELTAHEKIPSKRVAALHGLDAKPLPNAFEVPSFSSTAATVRPSPVANANPFSIAVGSAAASFSEGAKKDSLETVKKPFFPPVPSSVASTVSSSLGLFGTSSVSMTQPFGKPSVPSFSTAFTLPLTERFEDSKERNEPPGVSEASALSDSKETSHSPFVSSFNSNSETDSCMNSVQTAAAGQTFKSGGQSDASATGPVSFSKIGQSTATAPFGLAVATSAKTSSSFPLSFSSPSFSSHGTSSNTLPPQGISTTTAPLTCSPPASQKASSKTLPPLGISTNASFTFSPPAFAPVSCSTPTFSTGSSNGVPNFGSTLAGSPFGSKIAPAFASNVAIPGFGATTTTCLSSSTNISESLSGTCSASTSDAIVISSEAVSTSVPVFSFRSPSGGLKVPDIGSPGALFPEPTFTFGCGTSPPVSTSTQLPAGNLAFSGPHVGFGLLGSTTGSGSAVLPTLKVVTSPSQAPFDLSGGFASGPAGSEKSGRRFVKAKRRK